MLRHAQWTRCLTLIAMALLSVAAEARAQTPEGTVITNIATATYTDANGNAYAPVTGSVSVTVGFKAGVTVTANTPSPAAASPSTADTMTFTVGNVGNGVDSMTISEAISVPGVITVTGYRYGVTTYGTLAALNAALSSAAIAQGGSIVIKVVFNVASGQGGVTTVYTLTANSRRSTPTRHPCPCSLRSRFARPPQPSNRCSSWSRRMSPAPVTRLLPAPWQPTRPHHW